MNTLSNYLTRCLISNNIVEKEQEEEYVYGFQIIFGKLLSYTTLILLSLYYEVLIPGLIFMGVFFSLRGRTGGYHARTSLRCYFATVVTYLVVVQVGAPVLEGREYVSIIISMVSVIIVFVFAPINHPNLMLDGQEIQVCRQSSRWLVSMVAGCIWIAYALPIRRICIVYAVMGLGLDALSILIAKITGQEVKEE